MTIGTCITALIDAGVLTALRDLGRMPSPSMHGMRRTATAQATLLRRMLTGPAHQIPARIPELVPNLLIEHVAHLPVAGITYWADRRWHIHIRKEDPADVRAFTALHQLKRIIDQPLREQATTFTETDWNVLADHFARHTLATAPQPQNRKEESL
jgi:hypothetical protein